MQNQLPWTRIFLFVILPLISISFLSCGINVAVPKYKNPTCPTTISGRFNIPLNFPEMKAMMILTDHGSMKKMFGDYVGKTSDGIRFKADYGWATTTDEKLYKLNEVLCVIDSNCKVVYGSVPSKYQTSDYIMLLILQNKNGDEFLLNLTANEDFTFCIESGKYTIKYVNISSSDNRLLYQGRMISKAWLSLQESKDNWLGVINTYQIIHGTSEVKFFSFSKNEKNCLIGSIPITSTP